MRHAVLSLLLAALHGCSGDPGESRALPLATNAADSSWVWVFVPSARQYTYGRGVVGDRNGAYITGGFDRGFYNDGPDPDWGAAHLELRGETNFFIARHGADGSLRWARRYGDAGRISAEAIALGPDGSLYVVGTLRPGIIKPSDARWTTGAQTLVSSKAAAFVARFDTAGAVQWANIIEGAADVAEVAIDAGGLIYVAGSTGLPPALGAPGHAYIAAYTPSGKRSWFRIAAEGQWSASQGIAATPYGVCVVGDVMTDTDPGNPASEDRRRSGYGFAAGYSRTGTRLWHHEPTTRYPPGEPRWLPTSDSPPSMGINLNAAAGDKAGNCYAGGGFAGELEFGGDVLTSHYDPAVRYTPWGLTDAVILKYDVRGKPLWARRGIGGPKSDYVQGIAAKPDGGIVVAGDFMGIGDFGKFRLALPSPEPRSAQGRYILPPRGVFAATLSSDGQILHALQNVPEENGRPTGISVTGDGDVYITGTQDWAATYGRTRAPNSGINAFLARLSGL